MLDLERKCRHTLKRRVELVHEGLNVTNVDEPLLFVVSCHDHSEIKKRTAFERFQTIFEVVHEFFVMLWRHARRLGLVAPKETEKVRILGARCVGYRRLADAVDQQKPFSL